MTVDSKIPGPFLRTVCDCDRCKAPCRTMPGSLAPGDLEQIADLLGVVPSWDWVREHFEANDGAVVGKRVGDELLTFRVLTISPRLAPGGCVFLTADGHCSIHAASPWGCSMFDMHMSKAEGDRRALACLEAIYSDAIAGGPYNTTHARLVAAGRTSQPLSERVNNFNRELQKLSHQPTFWSETYP